MFIWLQVTGRGGTGGPEMERLSFCSVPLPLPKPWSQKTSQTAERLFFVSQPDAFPEKYLRDVFSRFAGLIEVYFIPSKLSQIQTVGKLSYICPPFVTCILF